MRKIIVDASYLLAVSKDASELRGLVNEGYRLVLTDTLVYELATHENESQSSAAIRKLQGYTEHAECWEHVGVMLKHELDKNRPYGNPDSMGLGSEQIRDLLERLIASPEGRSKLADEARKERESDTLGAVLRGFTNLEGYICGLRERIEHRPHGSCRVERHCRRLVNSADVIRTLTEGSVTVPIDDQWVTWHMVKGLIALFCDYVRTGTKDIAAMKEKALKRWANRKLDTDYLVCLAWADAIASGDNREMSAYRRWMYGRTKRMVSPMR